MVRSFRLEPELENRLREAARIAGVTESEFIREAIARRVAETFEQRLEDLLADITGVIVVPSNIAGNAGQAFTNPVADKHARCRRAESEPAADR